MLEEAKYERIGYKEYKSMPDYYGKYLTPACVTVSQISCMMGLIKDYRFADGGCITNVAETGVNIGLTDFYMLRVGAKYNKNFHLWGIEKIDQPNMGSVVRKEATNEEKSHWDFCVGKTVYDIESFMPEDTQLDMIFIDGAHAHPYPLIDLVYLLPYMRKDGLILFHDCEYYPLDGELGNSYIFTSWIGEKYLNRNINNDNMLSLLRSSLAENITNGAWAVVDRACSWWIKNGKTTDEDELKESIQKDLKFFQNNKVSSVVNSTLQAFLKDSTEGIKLETIITDGYRSYPEIIESLGAKHNSAHFISCKI